MQLSKEEYARKSKMIVRWKLKISVTRDNCLASLGKPRNAKQLPSWPNFQSASHNHWRFLPSRSIHSGKFTTHHKMSRVMRKPVFGVCYQVRLKLTSHSLESSIGIVLPRQRTTKALIRLHECAGWSVPLLFAYGINRFSHDLAQIISCIKWSKLGLQDWRSSAKVRAPCYQSLASMMFFLLWMQMNNMYNKNLTVITFFKLAVHNPSPL